MDKLERHLLKGAITVAGFFAVLAAVGNLQETTKEIGERRIKEAAEKVREARERQKKQDDLDRQTQRLQEKGQQVPVYPAAQPVPHPSETVELTEKEMELLRQALKKHQ